MTTRDKSAPIMVLSFFLCCGLAPALAAAPWPSNWQGQAGDLGLGFRATGEGILLESLRDGGTGKELLGSAPGPLFSVRFRDPKTGRQGRADADTGWRQVKVQPRVFGLQLEWCGRTEPSLAGLRVTVRVIADPVRHAWRWKLRVSAPAPPWAPWFVAFPLVNLGEFGTDLQLLLPQGPGTVQREAWKRRFTYWGIYPNGWNAAVSFLAAYDRPVKPGERNTGLYLAVHDPRGNTRGLYVESDPPRGQTLFEFYHPVPGMNVLGTEYVLAGEAVWQLFRGDWYAAALIYKQWVKRHASWWPRLTPEGRSDTPAWMKELPVWIISDALPATGFPAAREFVRFMRTPVALHWYQWHAIPFDNDYPHYFPAVPGFAEGVRRLQDSGIRVMPYLNGRLWDTRDRGVEDFQFTRVARPAVAKNMEGKPILESYGSTESDGSPVTLGVMCPTTALWRRKVGDIVLRLERGMNVDGVYLDQIGAAPPVECQDRTHGHPLGGGHWWVDGYREMLREIRLRQPPGRILTTECNAETYVSSFDGFLTWQWQYDGQVPVFPAIYGGAIQLFGRAYGGNDLAVRMKAGQQLVFGEQVGWFGPEIIRDPRVAPFLQNVVRARWDFRRYFSAGEMARPPVLGGDIPLVTADWDFLGPRVVTTRAVLEGAWQLPREKRLLLLFANVGDREVRGTLDFSGRTYGITSPFLDLTTVTDGNPEPPVRLPNRWRREILLGPRSVKLLEMRYGDAGDPPPG